MFIIINQGLNWVAIVFCSFNPQKKNKSIAIFFFSPLQTVPVRVFCLHVAILRTQKLFN